MDLEHGLLEHPDGLILKHVPGSPCSGFEKLITVASPPARVEMKDEDSTVLDCLCYSGHGIAEPGQRPSSPSAKKPQLDEADFS